MLDGFGTVVNALGEWPTSLVMQLTNLPRHPGKTLPYSNCFDHPLATRQQERQSASASHRSDNSFSCRHQVVWRGPTSQQTGLGAL
jgi:hypothetical protein